MKNYLRNLSIKRKMTLVMLVTGGIVLLMAYAAIFGFELFNARRNHIRDLTALAEIFADNSTGALAFKDKKAAQQILAALKAKPQIVYARLALKDGTVFAEYGGTGARPPVSARPAKRGLLFEGDYLLQTRPVVLDGEELGTLLLTSDVAAMRWRLLQLYGSLVVLMLLVSLLLTVFLSSRLQGVITGPILQLADTARIVAEKKDYSVRAQSQGRDELGLFTDAFNQMLTQIEERDRALRQLNLGMEAEIAERKRTEAALHESRQRYEVAVMGSSDGLWDTNLITNEVYYSPRWKNMIGYEDHELPNRRAEWEQRLHPEDRERVAKVREDYFAERIPHYQVEYRLRCKDGSYRWILSRGAVLRDGSGKPFRMAGSHTDITERKQAEQQMKELHAQLMEISRYAGMAEVATGVLHNVGNVLNSVNVSNSLVMEAVRKSKVASLAKAAALLREHSADLSGFLSVDPKGMQLPGFIIKLADHLTEEQARLLDELQLLSKNVGHIKDIVAMQQNYAKVCGVMESLPVVNLVEDALQMNVAGFTRHHIEVVREFQEVPPVLVDKHKVLQILINLLRNAKFAMDEARTDGKVLTLGISLNGDHRVKITVKDNGVGIAPENLTRIFSHGFTTRRHGHGFGLHSGALAAREMGGSLNVHSDGLGKGATFTLELPLAQQDSKS